MEQLLTPEVRGQVLFLMREAISNVLRHASATHARLSLVRSESRAVLTLEDDGRGFDTSPRQTERHRGLRNMTERARLMGGKLEVKSAPGGGTTVCLELPL